MLAPHLILAMFPRSPIIFVQRHPCDAVLSGFMQSFTPNLGMANFLDLSDAADFYDAAMTVWTAATATLPLNVRTVVYEDLVQEPEQQLRPLIEFLGLDWEDGLLDHRATAAARGAITQLQPGNRTIDHCRNRALAWLRKGTRGGFSETAALGEAPRPLKVSTI